MHLPVTGLPQLRHGQVVTDWFAASHALSPPGGTHPPARLTFVGDAGTCRSGYLCGGRQSGWWPGTR